MSTVQVPRSLQQLQMPVFHSFSNVQTFPVGCVRTVLKSRDWTHLEQWNSGTAYTIETKNETKMDYSIELKCRFALKSLVYKCVAETQLRMRRRSKKTKEKCFSCFFVRLKRKKFSIALMLKNEFYLLNNQKGIDYWDTFFSLRSFKTKRNRVNQIWLRIIR